MAGEIERWITVNGAHIPIIKGESRARAVANFIKQKREQRLKGGYGSKKAIDKLRRIAKKSADEYKKTPDIDDHKQRGSFLSSKEVAAIKKAQDQDEVDMALRYRRSLNKTIKGRAKTNEERYNDINKEYNEKVKKAQKDYLKDKYVDWDDYGAHTRAYNQKVKQAFEERNEKVAKGNLFKTPTYKLKAGTNPRKTQTIRGTTKTAKMKAADDQYKADVKSNRAYDKKYGKPTYSQIESDNRWRIAQRNKRKGYTYKMTDANRQK